MKLPEWLVKAGARLEGDRLFFDELEIDYQCQDIEKGEIPGHYQVRHYFQKTKDSGERFWNGFSCGLDLVESKELIWISGAMFYTFAEAFHHWKNSIRQSYEGDLMLICEDHMNGIQYGSCYCDPYRYNDEMSLMPDEPCNCPTDVIVHRPPTIKLVE